MTGKETRSINYETAWHLHKVISESQRQLKATTSYLTRPDDRIQETQRRMNTTLSEEQAKAKANLIALFPELEEVS